MKRISLAILLTASFVFSAPILIASDINDGKLNDMNKYHHQIDSIKSQIKFYEENFSEENRLKSLLSLQRLRIPFRLSDKLEDGFNYYTEKLKYYIEQDDKLGISMCYYVYGGFYKTNGLNDLSIYYYKKAQSYLDPNDENIYSDLLSGKVAVANLTGVLGEMYNTIGDYSNAIKYSKLSIKLSMSLQDTVRNEGMNSLAIDNKKIAFAKIMLNDLDSVDVLLFKALRIAEEYNQYYKGHIYQVMGLYYEQLDQIDSAKYYFNQSINEMKILGIPVNHHYGLLTPDYYLAKLYYNQKLYEKSEQILLNNIPKLTNLRQQKLIEYKLLIDVYLAMDNAESASEIFIKYSTLLEIFLADERANRNMSFETEQIIASTEQQMQNELSKQKQVQNVFILICVILLLAALFLFTRLGYAKKNRRLIELAKEKAEQSEKFKQQFLANMSHEIRTPMNAITGMTSLLLEQNPSKNQLKYLSGIKNSSETLIHIINDILDISKIEAGKLEFEKIHFSIHDVASQVLQTLEHKILEKELQVIEKIDVNVSKAYIGDPVRLNQVLMNIIGNAIKFTDDGSITLSIKGTDEGVLFQVRDTGIGIPKDKINTIFKNFSQAKTSDYRLFGGTGLGLSICKQLVELQGGQINIESEEGLGSTFSFVINYDIGSVNKVHSNIEPAKINHMLLDGLSILLVDDNEYNRTVAVDTLKSKATLEVSEAVNGQESLDILRENNYDIILMDVQMPVMDGIEATRIIREEFEAPKNSIPIIALTANGIPSELKKCLDIGMNDTIVKPFNPKDFINSIAKNTGRLPNNNSSNIEPESKKAETSDTITNLDYLESFCEGDKERMNKYISMFVDSAPQFMAKVNTALAKKEFETVANLVHGHKTSFIMMGMNNCKELAVSIEEKFRSAEVLNEHIDELNILLDQVKKAITELK